MKSMRVMIGALVLLSSGSVLGAETGTAKQAPATAAERYVAECSSCHMAYPAAMLPARSWQKLMEGLANHFGDNAELSEPVRKQITDYLLAGTAERNVERHAARFAASVPANETPLRISETPYFKREHREIPQRYIRDNPKVGGLSNCTACHTRAEQGSFREGEIVVPGVGRWEDD